MPMTAPRTDLRAYLDASFDRMTHGLPDTTRDQIRGAFDRTDRELTALLTERETVDRSPDLTAAGRVKARATLATKAADAAARVTDDVNRRLNVIDAELGDLEARALAGLEPDGDGWRAVKEPDRTPEQVAIEREIRDRLMALAPDDIRRRYVAAVHAGDRDFIRAVERAPRSFPIVDAKTLEQMRAWRIESSPLAPRRRALQQEREAYALLLNAAQRSASAIG